MKKILLYTMCFITSIAQDIPIPEAMHLDSIVRQLNPIVFKRLIKHHPIIYDFRPKKEFDNGYIEGAKHMDMTQPEFYLNLLRLKKDIHYFVYCQYGIKSLFVAKRMKEIGIKKIYVLRGGFLEWQDMKLEIKSNLPDSLRKKPRKKAVTKQLP